jgi:hypothetical protein
VLVPTLSLGKALKGIGNSWLCTGAATIEAVRSNRTVLIDCQLRSLIDANNAETEHTVVARLYHLQQADSFAGTEAGTTSPLLVLCYADQLQDPALAQHFPPVTPTSSRHQTCFRSPSSSEGAMPNSTCPCTCLRCSMNVESADNITARGLAIVGCCWMQQGSARMQLL